MFKRQNSPLRRHIHQVLFKARTPGFILVFPENNNEVSRSIYSNWVQNLSRILDSFSCDNPDNVVILIPPQGVSKFHGMQAVVIKSVFVSLGLISCE